MTKTEYRYPLAEIDDVQFRLSCGIDTMRSIHTAMTEGPFRAGGYGNAIFGATEYLRVLNEELRECIDALYTRAT